MHAPSLFTRVSAILVFIFMLIPLFVIVLFSFSDRSFFVFPPRGFSLQWYVRAWESGYFLVPALRSFGVAFLATGAASAIAIAAALSLRRQKGSRLAYALEFMFLSPLVIPHLILGIALLHYFNPPRLIDTFAGLLLAHIVLIFPFLFRTILTSVHELHPQLEEASEILGATPFTTFRRIIFPALVPGIVAGAILAFIVSFDQFTVSLLITQREQITLPVAIYKYLYDVNDPVAAAVSTVLVVVGFTVTLIVQRLGWMKSMPSG